MQLDAKQKKKEIINDTNDSKNITIKWEKDRKIKKNVKIKRKRKSKEKMQNVNEENWI